MIKEIFAKEFTNFTGRGHIMRMYELMPMFADNLVFRKGPAWKETRSCIAQFFTPAKLKTVMPCLLDAQSQLIENLGVSAESGHEVAISALCERFTFDVISKTAFGIDTEVQRNPGHPLFQTALAVFPGFMEGFLYHMGQNLFHWPGLLKASLKLLSLCVKNPLTEFTNKAKGVIEFRRTHPEVNKPDVAQLLLDYELGRRDAGRADPSGIKDRGSLPPHVMDRMASSCMSIFLGGYDTTRLALTYWFYLMGKHPNIQERMRKEVLEAYKLEGDHLSMETLMSLTYTNQVISETLRMYPPVISFTTRRAEEDWRFSKYLIKKGTSIMVPLYALHHDPLYWVNPEKFDPDRFSPENKHLINPIAYQPFGLGVRVCIGQRLALLELASITAQVLRHFRITLGPSQKAHLEIYTYSFLAVPKEAWIQVQRLDSVK
ncbi:cytochrome P450 9e2-like isoform X2 [Haemaphysalis longicornis]